MLKQDLGTGKQDVGHAEWLQADLEVVRGLHVTGALEAMKTGADPSLQRGVWGGLAWFAFPHLDLRADVIERSGQGPSTLTVLFQVNGYL